MMREEMSGTIMATRRQARIPKDLARDMILNGWDEEPIGGTDSGSDISDVEDPEYCPSGHCQMVAERRRILDWAQMAAGVRDDAVQMVRLLCFTYSKSASQENKCLTHLSSSFPLYIPSQNTLITSYCSDQHFTENNTTSY
ncbi:hypothetical protein MHYP_G00056250 [Metynnis hypsauchen]